MIIQDDEMKILKPLLDRLDIDYTQKTIKEVEDPEAVKKFPEWKKRKALTPQETKRRLKDIGIL